MDISKLNNVEEMAVMLAYQRPNKSKMERKFIRAFIASIDGMTYDKCGNRIKRIGTAPIMYSCHTDSVHSTAGYQEIVANKNTFKLSKHSPSNCLGADNAAGVWIMRQMILANKPGLYVFHRGEEKGCIGSKFINQHTPELVTGIKAAIAFDRRNTKSIITHMYRGRTCSDAFGNSLAKELHLGHELDDGGSVTDTAQYTDLIPECTNVSVGYDHEHSSRETLDMAYLIELRQAMLELDWEKLDIVRKPGTYEPRTYTYSKVWKPQNSHWGEYEKYRHTPKQIGFLKDNEQGSLLPDGHEMHDELKAGRIARKKAMDRMYVSLMIRNNPGIIADLLDDFGQSVDDIADHVYAHGGFLPAQMYGYDKYKDER